MQNLAEPHLFANPELSVEQRIDNLLSLMTLPEKVTCLGTFPAIPRLGIAGTEHVEGLHGLAQGGPPGWGKPKTVPTTTFPQAIGMAQTWEPELIRQAATAEATEARYIFQNSQYRQGGLVVRAPNADLGRDPRWGRTEECFGEDAHLVGEFVVAVVKGLQGDDPKYWRTAALLKHFLANSNEDGRGHSTSNFDERLLREYYAAPFERGIVEAGARAYMPAYNAYNGIPCTVSPLLRDLTVNEWGMDGIICTDAGAMPMLVSEHRSSPTLPEAAAASLKAGINQFLDRYEVAMQEALDQGLVTEGEIDQALRGTFRVMIRLGLLDPPNRVPYTRIGHEAQEPWQTEKHKSLARLVTQKSIVLLKNDADTLPLDARNLKSIAVIGPRGGEVLLDWYSGTPPYTVTPIDGIRARAGKDVQVNFAPSDDDGGAIFHAQNSDVAIVLVGNHPTGAAGWEKVTLPSYGKEAVDRRSITLEQEELVKKIYAVNPRTIVVLVSSFPYAINWSQQNVPAILHVTHGSQELGNAIADVLFGDINPAGRLVQTWPKSLEQLPPMLDYDIRHGRTYMYAKDEPLYPFGHGLSYTKFQYANLKTSDETMPAKGTINVSVDVTNLGKRAGDEVVQLYVKYLDSAVERPIKQLAAFRRVSIAAGETVAVNIELPSARLAYWDIASKTFVVEKGRVELLVGASSSDIRLTKTIEVAGDAN